MIGFYLESFDMIICILFSDYMLWYADFVYLSIVLPAASIYIFEI